MTIADRCVAASRLPTSPDGNLGALLARRLDDGRVPRRHATPSRVPEPTVAFWAAKAASTALGEAVSDFSIRVMAPEIAVGLGFVLFVAALALQLTRRRYIPGAYWLAVAAVGVFGTMAADVVHVVVGLPYLVTTAFYATMLVMVFVLWRRTTGTLSVQAVTTTRSELFYWAAVVGTFALGTAVGDLTAVGFGIGYGGSIVLFAVAILLPAAGYRWGRWNSVLAFWTAYVLTRPLGASVADGLAKPLADGGRGLGSGWVALGFAAILLVLVLGMRPSGRRTSAGPAR